MAQEDWSDLAAREDMKGFGETLDQKDQSEVELNEDMMEADRAAIADSDKPETSYEAGFGEDIGSFEQD